MTKILITNNQSSIDLKFIASTVFRTFNEYISYAKQHNRIPKKFIYISEHNCFAYRFDSKRIDIFLLDKYADVERIENVNNAAEVSRVRVMIKKNKNDYDISEKTLPHKPESKFYLSKKTIAKYEELYESLDKSIKRTNEVASKVDNVKRELFDTVRESVEKFIGDEKLLEVYKKAIIDKHRTTVYLMIKVASNSVLIQQKNKLPSSYQTLYECLKLLNEVERTQFEELIETKQLTSNTSKSDVVKLRKAYKTKLIDTESSVPTNYPTYSDVLEATQLLSQTDRLNILEYLIESISNEDRQGLISMYLDEAA